MKKDGFMDVAEVAGFFHVSPWTVRGWIRERRIPFYKICGRILFDRGDMEALRQAARVEPVEAER